MKRKIAAIILSSAMILTAFTGCQNNSEETLLMGQVTKINNNKITLAIGTMKQSVEKINAVTASGIQDNTTQGEITEGTIHPEPPQSGMPPQRGNGGTPPKSPQGESQTQFKLTGEKQTITINNESDITVEDSNKTSEGSIKDITVGSILAATQKGEKVTSVIIMKNISGRMAGSSTGKITLTIHKALLETQRKAWQA